MLCTKFEIAIASTVAEVSRGPKVFLDAPLEQNPADFGPKRCFLVSYSQNAINCVPF